MTIRLFTVVSEFRGTTDVRQVSASDERAAVRAWVGTFREEPPFARASTYLAKSIGAYQNDFPPIALEGIANVWCVTSSCGGDYMLANVIETAVPTNGS
jgi:hypothetical protein